MDVSMFGVSRTTSYIPHKQTYTAHLSIIHVEGRAGIEEFITMHPHMAKEATVITGPYSL